MAVFTVSKCISVGTQIEVLQLFFVEKNQITDSSEKWTKALDAERSQETFCAQNAITAGEPLPNIQSNRLAKKQVSMKLPHTSNGKSMA